MRRVLFVQSSLEPGGGGNAIAAWMLHALVADHDVLLLCQVPPRWSAIDAYYGTDLASRPPQVRLVCGLAMRGLPFKFQFFHGALLQRIGRALARDFDVVIGADGEADLGPGSITYVHTPTEYLTQPVRSLPWWKSKRPVATLYLRTVENFSGYNIQRMRSCHMVANSQWTADWIERVHGVRPMVLYPPAVGSMLEHPWSKREDAVLNIGRFSEEKRQTMAIDIVEKVRSMGVPLTLTLVGTTWDPLTERQVRRYASTRPWATIVANISRGHLGKLIGSHKYGLHCMFDEHYGMAPAELVRGGCLTLVHRSGGQVEIVNHEERLTFASPQEAAEKLFAAASSTTHQQKSLTSLQPLREKLGTERFCQEFRAMLA